MTRQPVLGDNDPFSDFFRHFQQQEPRDLPPEAGSSGSGFIVSADGYILTNAHVVSNASKVTVKLTDRREFEAKVIGSDERSDVAVIKIAAKSLPTVRIGDPARLRAGEWVGMRYNSVNCELVRTTGERISSTENICIDSSGTKLLVTDARDPFSLSTASRNGAVYSDPNSYLIQNLLLDTLNKRIFLIFNAKMSILNYGREPAMGVKNNSTTLSLGNGIIILRGTAASSVTIILPTHSRFSALYFYDLSGRVVDKMLGVTSNAVLWRPKTRTMSCYIVMVKSGQEKFTKKFMMK